jgi:hypothetical protein
MPGSSHDPQNHRRRQVSRAPLCAGILLWIMRSTAASGPGAAGRMVGMTSSTPVRPTDLDRGKFANGGTVAQILAKPQDFYVNVHNAEFPGGAIRGQLSLQR